MFVNKMIFPNIGFVSVEAIELSAMYVGVTKFLEVCCKMF